MKRVVYPPADQQSDSNSRSYATVDDVPDIANRYLSVDTIISWLDKLEEVHNNETNISNN